MDFPDDADKVLNLNVGGCSYSTVRSTLTSYPDSMLGSMFSGRFPTSVDDCNRYVIDGDGPTFRHILNFLRRSKLVLPDGFNEWDILSAEADYYQLHELSQLIDVTRKKNQQDEETRTQIRQDKTKYEFIEVETHFADFLIFCKTDILRQLSEKCSATFDIELVKDRDYMSENGYSIQFLPGRTLFFELITEFGFTLISTSSVCFNSEVGLDKEKWTFSRKQVAKN